MSIIRLLIQCGADVNEICDNEGNRPLHFIAQCSNIVRAKPVIELLLAFGAHPDAMNYKGYLPKDIAKARDVKILLSQSQKLSLKCRCARMIISTTINYQKYLSPNLIAFIQLHSNSERNQSSDRFRFNDDFWWRNQY